MLVLSSGSQRGPAKPQLYAAGLKQQLSPHLTSFERFCDGFRIKTDIYLNRLTLRILRSRWTSSTEEISCDKTSVGIHVALRRTEGHFVPQTNASQCSKVKGHLDRHGSKFTCVFLSDNGSVAGSECFTFFSVDESGFCTSCPPPPP